MRHSALSLRSALPFTFKFALLVSASPAVATDGVIEINQASVNAAAGFPFVITSGGSYRLTSSLTVTDSDTSAIVINNGVSNVHIDLNGFTISDPNVCSAITGECSASGSGNGIHSLSNGNGENISIANGTVRGMGGDGISSANNSNQRVEGVRAISNGGVGIRVGSFSTLLANQVSRNGNDGITAGPGSLIQANTATWNGGDGIQATSGGTIRGNTSSTNGGYGLNTIFSSSAGYGGNVFTCNNNSGTCANGAQVSGGREIGVNVCGTDTTCP